MKGARILLKARKLLQKSEPNLEIVTLLEKARRLGNPEAIFAIGTWYFHGIYFKKNRKKGFSLFLQAAELNFPTACFDVAVSYERGIGIIKDEKKAFQFYYKAMLLGYKQAVYEVGRCYCYGIGVKVDKKLADLILTIAVEYYKLT